MKRNYKLSGNSKVSHHTVVVPVGELYEGDSDSSPEPLSEYEEQHTRSSIVSSIGTEIESRPETGIKCTVLCFKDNSNMVVNMQWKHYLVELKKSFLEIYTSMGLWIS